MFKCKHNENVERFDWDEYFKDIKNGIGAIEQVKKRQKGGYMTTKSVVEKPVPQDGVLDIDRYNNDKKLYGEAYAEVIRRNGGYKYMKRF